MKYKDRTMLENSELGGIKQSIRNEWGRTLENRIKELSPFPITYDVTSTQPTRFTEFSYTEFLGGIILSTQCIEINNIILSLAREIPANDNGHVNFLYHSIADKYELISIPDNIPHPKKIAILPGTNAIDIVSKEMLSRLAFEDEDFYVKPHPLTTDEGGREIGRLVGWDRIIDKDVSGVELIKNSNDVYLTTATELATVSVLLDKNIYNISNFFKEAGATYYSINNMLFKAKDNIERKQILNNLLSCKFSGILFPWMTDIEDRMKNFFSKSLEVRKIYGSKVPPIINNIK